MSTQKQIGFIGLGTMGFGMAANLLAAGHAVRGYNRTRAKAEPLRAKGLELVDSPQAAAAESEIAITMLSDDPAVEEVLLGERGALASAKAGTLFIDSSTVTPGMSRRCSEFARSRGLRHLDAPVTGSRNEANGGKLVFIVGGERKDYDEAAPLFDAMGQARFYCGPSGSGATLKLCNNAISGTLTTAMAESATVVRSSGIDQDVALSFLSEHGAFSSRLSRTKLPKMFSEDFSANFQLKLMAKDIRYFLALAQESNRDTPAIKRVEQTLREAIDAGFGDDDIAAVFAYLMKSQTALA
jgi:3-hydroxyisobutyrate dehydrogenase